MKKHQEAFERIRLLVIQHGTKEDVDALHDLRTAFNEILRRGTMPQEYYTSQAHKRYAILAKYADGTRSMQEIADCLNKDAEFVKLGLSERTAYNVPGNIQLAKAHGYDVRVKKPGVPDRDVVALWKSWVIDKETIKSIAKRIGLSQSRAGWILHREHRRQRSHGVVNWNGKIIAEPVPLSKGYGVETWDHYMEEGIEDGPQQG